MKTIAKRSGPFWDGVERRAPITAYVEAALHDSTDATIAVATATARVIPPAVARTAV